MELDGKSQMAAEVGDGRCCLVLMGSERACRERSRPHQPQRQSVLFPRDRGAQKITVHAFYTAYLIYIQYTSGFTVSLDLCIDVISSFPRFSPFSPYSHPSLLPCLQYVTIPVRWLSNKSGSFQRLGKAVNASSKLTD